MGFAPDVKRVLAKLPARRQSLLFSATMPEAIRTLAGAFLHNPVRVEVAPVATTAERIDQRVCHVARSQKRAALVHLLQEEHGGGLSLVFVRMKHGADRLVKQLAQSGVRAAAIHGNKSQGARQRALEAFRAGETNVLVATDIAARGIDVKGISLVVNYDLPNEPEAYVHRIGRTARAGAEGVAVSLCDETERTFLRDIQRLIRREIPEMRLPALKALPALAPEVTGGGGRGRHGESGQRPVRTGQRSSQSRARGSQRPSKSGGGGRRGASAVATEASAPSPTGFSRMWGRLSRLGSRRS
jgi:ATP-dependent RNA helicase RhlE